MKKLITSDEYLYDSDYIFGMANLSMKRTGLSVIIWSDHGVAARNKKDKRPRFKVGTNDDQVSVSLDTFDILAQTPNIKKSVMNNILVGIEYVKRNADLFRKHYYDLDESFDDEDLYNALRERGEYK